VAIHGCLKEPDTKQNTADSRSGFQLPEELLPNILRFVDIQQRMRNTALVCKAWRAAANAATTCLSITIRDRYIEHLNSGAPRLYFWTERREALEAWLSRDSNAQNVTSICVEAADAVLQAELDRGFVPKIRLQRQQLPHLHTLKLSGCCLGIKLEPATVGVPAAARGRRRKSSSINSQAAPLAPLAGTLTALELRNVTFGSGFSNTFPADNEDNDDEGVLSHLSVLTSLQRLRISEAFTVGRHTPKGVGLALCKLPQLTHLLLDTLEDSDDALELTAAAGALQQLQELELRYDGAYAGYRRHLGTHLPCSITSLKVIACCAARSKEWPTSMQINVIAKVSMVVHGDR
jgi:hypothetical protein